MLNLLVEATEKMQKEHGDIPIVIELEKGIFFELKGMHVLQIKDKSIAVLEGGEPV